MDIITFFLILGILQGVLEWLPVSSSGNVTLLVVNYVHVSFSEAVKVSFFLHGGTMLSVLVKFRSKIFKLAKDVLSAERTPFLDFYIVATIVSAVVGLPLYLLLELEIPEQIGSLMIAFFLILTGIIIRKQRKGLKSVAETTLIDSCIVGIVQGISIIPGISRSGMTISALLSRGVNQEEALQLSFLLSIPPVLGLMVLGFSGFQGVYLLSMGVSFVCSLLTMEIMLKTAQKLNFSYFCFAVALVTILIVGLVY
ncbi:MAG: undecaprenyl-diphosphate phosphatase [Theionarchaea archaeon]|nr:undecaprenyl-diphosphate phosphatase [Theionarchaea archaeon]